MFALSHHKPALQPEEVVLLLLHAIYFCNLFTVPWGQCLWLYYKSDQSKLFLVAISWAVLNQVTSKTLLPAELRKTILMMATGRAGKGRAASLGDNGGLCWLTVSPETQPLTPGHLLLRGVLFDPRPAQHSTWATSLRQRGRVCQYCAGRCPEGHTLPAWWTHTLMDTHPEQSHLLLAHTCFLLTEHFLRSSQQRFEQLIYILGNNCSLLALNKPLCLAETRECNMSFTKLSQDSRDRLQKYALYSGHLSE